MRLCFLFLLAVLQVVLVLARDRLVIRITLDECIGSPAPPPLVNKSPTNSLQYSQVVAAEEGPGVAVGTGKAIFI